MIKNSVCNYRILTRHDDCFSEKLLREIESSWVSKETSTKISLLDLSLEKLSELFVDLGEPSFRAEQLFRWIWQKGVTDYDSMSNVSAQLRERLKNEYPIAFPKIHDQQVSSDGTIKFLSEMDDGKKVETVWIPREDQNRVTVCISTQVGCRMGCKFCLTAQQKTERNLSPGEIASQLMILPNREKITNVVVMGMGLSLIHI